MQTELTTYLRAGYPGLAITTAEEAPAEAEIAAIKRKLSAWSSTDGLVDTSNNRATPCPDPFEALQLLERMFASSTPQHVVLMRDLQLHHDQTNPVFTRRLKDLLHRAKGNGHAIILLGCRHKLPPELEHDIEKGFSGSQGSGNTDGGTSSRVFGSFLSWMQEKEKPVFVVATANDVSQLPPGVPPQGPLRRDVLRGPSGRARACRDLGNRHRPPRPQAGGLQPDRTRPSAADAGPVRNLL